MPVSPVATLLLLQQSNRQQTPHICRDEGMVVPKDKDGKTPRQFAELTGGTNFGYAAKMPVSCESELRKLAEEARTTRNGNKLLSFCELQIKSGKESYRGINYILQQEGLCLNEDTFETNVRSYTSYSLYQIIKDEEGIYRDGLGYQYYQRLEHAIEFYRLHAEEDANEAAGLSPECDFYGKGCLNCKGCGGEEPEDESEVW